MDAMWRATKREREPLQGNNMRTGLCAPAMARYMDGSGYQWKIAELVAIGQQESEYLNIYIVSPSLMLCGRISVAKSTADAARENNMKLKTMVFDRY